MKQSRNEDCFSSVLGLLLGFIGYHRYFNVDWDTNVYLFAAGLLYKAYDVYSVANICMDQYDGQVETQWFADYEMNTIVKPGEATWEDYALQTYSVASSAYSLWKVRTSRFYYFERGQYMASLFSDLIILANLD